MPFLRPQIKTISLILFLAALWSFSYIYSDHSSPSLGFHIKDETQAVGIHFLHKKFSLHPSLKNVDPWVASNGAGVSVVDFNNDGYQDIFLNNSKKNEPHHLYINKKNGSFEEVSSLVGLNKVKSQYPIMGSFFYDCNKDGYKDLFLLSYCPQVFENVNGRRLKDITSSSGLGCVNDSIHANNLIDYNDDGLMDIVLAGYHDVNYFEKPPTDRFMPGNTLDSKNAAQIYFYKNLGACRFKKEEKDLGVKSDGWNIALGVYDFDKDNRADLWVAKDFGNDSLYFRDKKGFLNYSEKINTKTTSKNGMNSEIGDFNNDGRPDVFVSHIMEKAEKVNGNLMWSYVGNRDFEENARSLGVHDCGWSWGGKFVDLNNDSYLDLVVANGFISANPQKNSYWYALSVLASGDREEMEDYKNWPDLTDQTLSGYQRNCLYLNRRGKFEDVAPQTVFKGHFYDSRGVAIIDHNNDGNLSLVVANQNSPAKFYSVKQDNKYNWLGIELVLKHGAVAFGARLVLEASDGQRFYRQLQPMNGYSSQSDPRVHFGLAQRKLKKLMVTWPNGKEETFTDKQLRLNSYNKLTQP